MTPENFDFSKFTFGSVIDWPASYEIYDFTHGYDPNRKLGSEYGVGRYNELRPGMYTTALFSGSEKPVRNIHVGIDLAAPVGALVRAFYAGVVFLSGINPAAGDYGGTVITEHQLDGKTLWALHGHLSHESVRISPAGRVVQRGDVLGHLGDREENGGWNPHLHFQLSWVRPERCDLPGVVSSEDREAALRMYPDPRHVLGPLYKD